MGTWPSITGGGGRGAVVHTSRVQYRSVRLQKLHSVCRMGPALFRAVYGDWILPILRLWPREWITWCVVSWSAWLLDVLCMYWYFIVSQLTELYIHLNIIMSDSSDTKTLSMCARYSEYPEGKHIGFNVYKCTWTIQRYSLSRQLKWPRYVYGTLNNSKPPI